MCLLKSVTFIGYCLSFHRKINHASLFNYDISLLIVMRMKNMLNILQKAVRLLNAIESRTHISQMNKHTWTHLKCKRNLQQIAWLHICFVFEYCTRLMHGWLFHLYLDYVCCFFFYLVIIMIYICSFFGWISCSYKCGSKFV